MTRLTRYTRTTAFKLSLLYIAVFTVMSGFLLVYISENTDHLMSEQVVQTVDAELKGLSDVYFRGGVRDLVETIDERSRHPDASLYLLVDFAGNALVGNIARLPTVVLEEADGGLRRVRYTRLGQDTEKVERQAMVRTFELRGGFRLLVGRDLGDQLRFSNLLGNALRLWLIVVILLAAITWFFVNRRVMKRIDEISATSRTIMTGDLTRRLPVAGNDDEFDRLAVNLNTMLERIELLMQSMKDVTDNIAHDLKTPLTRLQSRVETALREAREEEGYRSALEATLDETDNLLRIFNALLRIARIESTAPGSVMEPSDLGKLVAEIAELYEPLVEDEGGRLETDVPDGLMADCNKDLISQVLVNL
ncbi:HAMP domain-containing protein, partial [Roseibium sp.]